MATEVDYDSSVDSYDVILSLLEVSKLNFFIRKRWICIVCPFSQFFNYVPKWTVMIGRLVKIYSFKN